MREYHLTSLSNQPSCEIDLSITEILYIKSTELNNKMWLLPKRITIQHALNAVAIDNYA